MATTSRQLMAATILGIPYVADCLRDAEWMEIAESQDLIGVVDREGHRNVVAKPFCTSLDTTRERRSRSLRRGSAHIRRKHYGSPQSIEQFRRGSRDEDSADGQRIPVKAPWPSRSTPAVGIARAKEVSIQETASKEAPGKAAALAQRADGGTAAAG